MSIGVRIVTLQETGEADPDLLQDALYTSDIETFCTIAGYVTPTLYPLSRSTETFKRLTHKWSNSK